MRPVTVLPAEPTTPMLRIGALAARTGVTTHVLRVWEERHGLLSPVRSPGGYRLYTAADEQRVLAMKRLRAEGCPAAEAARQVLADRVELLDLGTALDRLTRAIAAYDETTVHEVLDAALAGHPVAEVMDRVCFPLLRRLGDDWEAGRITVAQEHYASGLVRGRLAALTPDLTRVPGPRSTERRTAVLACTPHERHDIGLLGLDLVLRQEGWQVTFLGADTPIEDSAAMARALGADVLLLCGTEPHMFAAQVDQQADLLQALATEHVVALAGPAADPGLARRAGATCLTLDTVAAAHELAVLAARRPVSS